MLDVQGITKINAYLCAGKRVLRHYYQKRWTAPSYLTSTVYLHTALRMVYLMRCVPNNGHQPSTLLRVCCQKENRQLVRVCCREEKTHNREIAVQLVSDCYQEKTQLVRDCYREKKQMRTNQSLVVMKARNNKELKETTKLNELNEPNDYMTLKSY